MLRYILFTFPFLLTCFYASGQEDELLDEDRSSYISAGIGLIAAHQSSFLLPNGNKLEKGSGYHLGIQGVWMFHRYLGLSAEILYARTGDTNSRPINRQGNYVVTFSDYSWNEYFFQGGPVFAWPLDRVIFELKSQAGVALAQTGVLRYSPLNSSLEEYFYRFNGPAPLWSNQLGMRLDVGEHWNISLSYEYQYQWRKTEITSRGEKDNLWYESRKTSSLKGFDAHLIRLNVVYRFPHYNQ